MRQQQPWPNKILIPNQRELEVSLKPQIPSVDNLINAPRSLFRYDSRVKLARKLHIVLPWSRK